MLLGGILAILVVVTVWGAAWLLFRDAPVNPMGMHFFSQAHERITAMGSAFHMDAYSDFEPRPRWDTGLDDDDFDDDDDKNGDEEKQDKEDGSHAPGLYGLLRNLLSKIEADENGASLKSMWRNSESMVRVLGRHCCVVPADAAKIQILSSPAHFFEQLKERIANAKHRIVISALYVGDGPLSKEFLQVLESKVEAEAVSRSHSADRRNADTPSPDRVTTPLPSQSSSTDSLLDPNFLHERFTLDVVLDYNRMHDRKNMLTVRRLAELASRYRDVIDVRIHLFQTPSSLNRFLGPFGRSKEMLGVQHTKIFTFDDEDTILTGANLSDDYFKNRMDRYMVVEGNAQLAEWCTRCVETLASLSHRVVFAAEDALPPEALVHAEIFANTSPTKSMGSPKSSTESLSTLGRLSTPSSPEPKHRLPTVHSKSKLMILPNNCMADPTHDHAAFREAALERFQEFAADMYLASEERLRFLCGRIGAEDRQRVNTLLFPTLQFGRVGIHHDVHMVEQVLKCTTQAMRVCLTSPYLNMYWRFTEQVLKSKAAFDFITASVKSNGWSGQKGMAGQIPYFYLQLERNYYFLMESFGCTDRVKIREYTEPGMTFHAKGLWILDQQVPMDASGGNLQMTARSDILGDPFLAAYGSTNYGNRSIHKDVEVEAFVLTWDASLRHQMRVELQRLMIQSEEVSRDRFVGARQGRFQPVVALIASMGQDYL